MRTPSLPHATDREFTSVGWQGFFRDMWKWVTSPRITKDTISNLIDVPTTIPADSSYVVISYITIDDDLVIDGNLLIVG